SPFRTRNNTINGQLQEEAVDHTDKTSSTAPQEIGDLVIMNSRQSPTGSNSSNDTAFQVNNEQMCDMSENRTEGVLDQMFLETSHDLTSSHPNQSPQFDDNNNYFDITSGSTNTPTKSDELQYKSGNHFNEHFNEHTSAGC